MKKRKNESERLKRDMLEMLPMWLDLLSWIVGGLMSSFAHAASFCLHAAGFSAHARVRFPICPFFDLPSHLLLRHLESAFKASFSPPLLRTLGKKIAAQTTDVCSDPGPPLPFFKEWYVPNPLTQLNKGDIMKEHWRSFVQL